MNDKEHNVNAIPAHESIMVCVCDGPNAEHLLSTGRGLADVFDAPLTLLTVDPLNDADYTETKSANMALWATLARRMQAEFIALECPSHNVAQTIADVAKERHITQIVLGQCSQSRWEECTKGSIINKILRKIEFIDIHIAAIQRKPHTQQQPLGAAPIA